MTDGGGTITERYAYDAYGTPTIADAAGTTLTTSADNNRYTYTGREYDEALGLYHYRARMYDSVAGRFCSRDPIGYADGMSLYRNYFGQHATDPEGLCRCKASISVDLNDPYFGPNPNDPKRRNQYVRYFSVNVSMTSDDVYTPCCCSITQSIKGMMMRNGKRTSPQTPTGVPIDPHESDEDCVVENGEVFCFGGSNGVPRRDKDPTGKWQNPDSDGCFQNYGYWDGPGFGLLRSDIQETMEAFFIFEIEVWDTCAAEPFVVTRQRVEVELPRITTNRSQ